MSSTNEAGPASRLPPGHVHFEITQLNESVSTMLTGEIPIHIPEKMKFLSATTAQRIARAHVHEIFTFPNELHLILERHEAVIGTRWIKRNKEQRKSILLTAWPNMTSRHQPDFRQLFDPATKREPDDEEIYKWPHINLEDLVEAKLFLLLLNARGRLSPHVFAHAEMLSFNLGRQYDKITQNVVLGHTMFLADGMDEQTFGPLVPWQRAEDLQDFLTDNQLLFEPTAGLLVLEVQSCLLKFLLACCHQLLRDIARPLLTGSHLPVFPEPEPLSSQETSYLQVSAMIAKRPYRAPTMIDTARILQLVEARKLEAEDHVWDLREHPGYFASVMSDYYHHCRGILCPVPGLPSHCGDKRLTWNKIVWVALSETYIHLGGWDVLLQKSLRLHVQTQNNFDQYDRQRPLPKDVEETIIDMSITLSMLVGRLTGILRSAVPV